jgi:uncharacterized pyridoxal phosphate-containing UPF0001 family protein
MEAYDAGQAYFGENKIQEMEEMGTDAKIFSGTFIMHI